MRKDKRARPIGDSDPIYEYDDIYGSARGRGTSAERTKGQQKKKKKKKGSPILRGLKFLIAMLLFMGLVFTGAVSVAVAMYLVRLSDDLPSMVDMANPKSSLPSVIYDRNNEVIARLFIENRTPVELSQVSPWMIRSVLAVEDSAFYQHSGIRIGSILRAVWVDVIERGKVQGASTITQQLARNLFLSQEKSITRKAKEMIIAMRMEKLFSKDKILELYLNTINFGRGAWGIETAARTYFGTSASELTLSQASILAGLIANPGRYNPVSNIKNAKSRQNHVLARMELLGWITPEQRQQAYGEELEFKSVANKIEVFNRAPYFVSHILFNDLLPKYGKDQVYSGGMKIYTTLDVSLQEKAREAVNSLPTMGALVCMESETGEVLALVGGKDFNQSKFNRATQAFRQPGSSFKPIVYAAALEEDIMPSDHFLDAPITFGRKGGKGWSPKNSSGGYSGEVTVQKAICSSLNTVAVRVGAYIGTDTVVRMARSMGIESKHLPNDLSVSLGTASLTPLEMAVAFNCFNNGGMRMTPLMIREIRSDTDELIEKREPHSTRGMKPETAYSLRSMLQDTIRAGTGTRAAIKGVNVFGKTGTSNDFIDAWFVGGVPGMTAAVYVGNDNHTTMGRKGFGGTLAAPAWQKFMSYAVSRMKTAANFPSPPDWVEVDKISICRTTGYRAIGGCPGVPLFFPKGKSPTAKCPTHGGSYDAAANDPRGPRLFLIERDEEQLAALEAKEEEQQQYVPPQQPAAVNPNLVPSQQNADMYRTTPDRVDDVEKRYQDLLKEYGLN